MADFDAMFQAFMVDLDGDGVPDAVAQQPTSGGPSQIDPRAPLPYVPGDPNAPPPISADNPEAASPGMAVLLRNNGSKLLEVPTRLDQWPAWGMKGALNVAGHGLELAGTVAGATGGPSGAVVGPLMNLSKMARYASGRVGQTMARAGEELSPTRRDPVSGGPKLEVGPETAARSAETSRLNDIAEFEATTKRMESPLMALPPPTMREGVRRDGSSFQYSTSPQDNLMLQGRLQQDRARVAREGREAQVVNDAQQRAQSQAERGPPRGPSQTEAQIGRDAQTDQFVSNLLQEVGPQSFERVLANDGLPVYLSKAGMTMDDFTSSLSRLGYYTRPYAQSRIQGNAGGFQSMNPNETAFRDAMRQGRIPPKVEQELMNGGPGNLGLQYPGQ